MLVAIVGSAYWLYTIINTPMEFERERKVREAKVIDRLKDIRTAQRAYRSKYFRYTPSFDSLAKFILTDSLVFEHAVGSEDDSTAVAAGQVQKVQFKMAVKDTVFPKGFDPEKLQYIPYSDLVNANLGNGEKLEKFRMDTASIETESKVVVPVFETFAPYTTFLGDLNKQELINFRDVKVNTMRRDDGLKVGSLTASTNEAGNWE